jgi:hypothetical protein
MEVLDWILFAVIFLGIALSLYYAFRPIKSQPESFTERPRVVVSFSTIPSRLPFLSGVSNQINKQTFKPDAVYACIPMFSERLGKAYDLSTVMVPENLTVIRCEDYGPATKLLGCLEHEQDPDTIIITIDDDIEYSSDLLRNLVSEALQNPSAKVGSRATNRNNTFGINPRKRVTDDPDIVLEGFGGVAYRRSMITDPIRTKLQSIPYTDPCWKSDDITFDRLIIADKVKIPNLVDNHNTQLEHIDALQDDARRHTYNLCMANLGEDYSNSD